MQFLLTTETIFSFLVLLFFHKQYQSDRIRQRESRHGTRWGMLVCKPRFCGEERKACLPGHAARDNDIIREARGDRRKARVIKVTPRCFLARSANLSTPDLLKYSGILKVRVLSSMTCWRHEQERTETVQGGQQTGSRCQIEKQIPKIY